MDIDWSKAPEGTEAAHPGNNGCYPAWYRRDAAGLVEQICPEAEVYTWAWMGSRRDFPHGSVLRPTSDKQTWTGEGRPPVGIVCEYQHGHHSGAWYDGKILYISSEYTIVLGDPVNEQHYYTRNLKFRPIRTPEQIAEEAKEKAIDVIEKRILDRIGDLNVRNLAEDLFDLLGEMSKSTDQ